MARKQVTHLQLYKKNVFGGVTNTTLCRRVRNGADYNNTTVEAEVTCSFCLKQLEYRNRKAA